MKYLFIIIHIVLIISLCFVLKYIFPILDLAALIAGFALGTACLTLYK
jgi:hypothetical protein